MRTLFVVPPAALTHGPGPVDRVYGCNYAYDVKPPIHLLTVATMLDEEGHCVRVFDGPAEGASLRDFDAVIEEGWDAVLFYTVYLSIRDDLAAARRIRQRHRAPLPKMIFMCTGANWKPDAFEFGDDSFIILGEPERTVLELIAMLEGRSAADPSTIDGLGYWRNGRYRRTGFRNLLDVNDLPIPNRRLLRGTYRLNRLEEQPATVLYTSRGCGYRCTFCTPNAVDQGIELEYKKTQEVYVKRPPLRTRRPELVIEEFRQLSDMGYRSVEICDNLFIFDRDRTMAILDGIKALGLHWLCLSRAPFLHDEELVRAMADAGCQLVYIGSESFSQAILDDVHKDLKVSDIKRAVETCRAAGVTPEVSVMMGGSPLETKETIRKSLREATRLGTDFVHFSIALPSPSTELYDLAREGGWFVDGDFRPIDNAREAIINLPNLSAGELKRELKRAYRAQYLSPRGLLRQAARIRTRRDFVEKAKTAGKLLRYLVSG